MSGNSEPVAVFDRLLAQCMRGDAPCWPEAELGQCPQEVLLQRVQFHGVAGLLAEIGGVLAPWPDGLRQKVLEDARMQAFWEESHRDMLAELLEQFAQSSIEPLLMKGSALAYSLYAQPYLRRRGDSDLLVPESQVAAARAVLLKRCFARRDDPHGLFFQETWLGNTGNGLVHAIDLHWQPNDSPALQKVLPVAEYFSRKQPLPRLSPHVGIPCAVLTFLQGALNQAWHGSKGYFVGDERLSAGGRLIWAWDNHLLAAQFSERDWAELTDMAIARDVAPFCLAALESARANCATDIPDCVFMRLRAAPQNTDMVRHLVNANRISAFFTDFRAIPTLRAKAAFAFGHAFPASNHLRRKYPRSAGWPIALLHARRIGESALRLARLR